MNLDTPQRPAPAARTAREDHPARASQRQDQADATRALLLATAERLYAEHGISGVSNRHVAEAAGSSNNSAVGYHFGSKAALLAAIADSHGEVIGEQVERMVVQARGSSEPRDHVASLVRPYTDHLASLGTPSWFARLSAQMITDPTLGGDLVYGAPSQSPLVDAYEAMWASGPPLPDGVVVLRQQMARVMVVHTCAEQERAAAQTGVPADWTLVGDSLIDAVTHVLLAPRG